MDDMASLWCYQESIDELKQKLLYTTFELESVRLEANEEMRKNKDSVKQLLQLLKIAYQERDEAKDQLQKLLNKIIPPTTTPTEFFTALPLQLQPQSPLFQPTKANSSITESNSLSDTPNHQSHGSSPVDSFFDTVSSPELSTMNLSDSTNLAYVNQPFVQDYNGSVSKSLVSPGTPKIDQSCLVIEKIAKGKALPQKGKLLQAVIEAGPLLQTLLVAGPLPRWRNPPPLQPLQVPPVSIKGCDDEVVFSTSSVLTFGNGFSGSCLGSGKMITAGGNAHNNFVPSGKRQRFQ